MKLYVARHGRTAFNAQARVCGRTDLDLTREGEQQAQDLARLVEDKGIARIVASPMLRAQRTAAFAAQALGLPVETDGRLIEQDYGVFEGVDVHDEGFLDAKRRFAFRYPGGESMMQVAARVYPLLDELRRGGAEGNVLLVCHGGVCRIIRSYFEDMTNEDFFRYSAPNCGLEEYEL